MRIIDKAESTLVEHLCGEIYDELLNFFVNGVMSLSKEESREYWDFLIALHKAVKGALQA